jgi:glutathione synthase/RimK-type ligase-like ATP-grasp enzyme
MRIALTSDFRDYYDHWFEAPHHAHERLWERHARGGLARPALFAYMERLGLRTPIHGSTRQVAAQVLGDYPSAVRARLAKYLELVVYRDPFAHQGEGKLRITMAEALQSYPDQFAAEFLPANTEGLGESLRYLRIGRRPFWLRYASANDWRSNVGDVTVEVLAEEKPLPEAYCDSIKLPLFAVDFVRAWGRGGLYAVDFNTAPGLAGTGMEQYLTAREVYEEIAGALASPWVSGLAQAA